MKTLGPFQELKMIPLTRSKVIPGCFEEEENYLLLMFKLFRIEGGHGQLLEPVRSLCGHYEEHKSLFSNFFQCAFV